MKAGITCLCMFFALSAVTLAGEKTFEDKLLKMVDETKRTVGGDLPDETAAYAWWLPPSMWKMMLQNKGLDANEQYNAYSEIMGKYHVFLLGYRGDDGSGEVSLFPVEKIQSMARLVSDSGKPYMPLINDEAQKDALKIEAALLDVIGEVSDTLHVVMYPTKGPQQEDTISPQQHGQISLAMGELKFKWRLPLSAAVPPVVCPKCHEEFVGSYRFCPYDGTELRSVKAKERSHKENKKIEKQDSEAKPNTDTDAKTSKPDTPQES